MDDVDGQSHFINAQQVWILVQDFSSDTGSFTDI